MVADAPIVLRLAPAGSPGGGTAGGCLGSPTYGRLPAAGQRPSQPQAARPGRPPANTGDACRRAGRTARTHGGEAAGTGGSTARQVADLATYAHALRPHPRPLPPDVPTRPPPPPPFPSGPRKQIHSHLCQASTCPGLGTPWPAGPEPCATAAGRIIYIMEYLIWRTFGCICTTLVHMHHPPPRHP